MEVIYFLWEGGRLWIIIQKVKLEYVFSGHCSIVPQNTFADIWVSLLCNYHRWFALWNYATAELVLLPSLYDLKLFFSLWVL